MKKFNVLTKNVCNDFSVHILVFTRINSTEKENFDSASTLLLCQRLYFNLINYNYFEKTLGPLKTFQYLSQLF